MTSVEAGLADPAAVAYGIKEAAVACVTGVATGQLVAQAGLLVAETAAGRADGAVLEANGLGHVLRKSGSHTAPNG